MPAAHLRAVGLDVVLAQLEVVGRELALGLGLWHSVGCWRPEAFCLFFQFQLIILDLSSRAWS